MYECMHACIHAYMHACTHAHMHACTHARMHACTHTRIHTYTHTRRQTYIHTYIQAGRQTDIHTYMCICIYIYMYMYVCIYVCMYVYMYICIHIMCDNMISGSLHNNLEWKNVMFIACVGFPTLYSVTIYKCPAGTTPRKSGKRNTRDSDTVIVCHSMKALVVPDGASVWLPRWITFPQAPMHRWIIWWIFPRIHFLCLQTCPSYVSYTTAYIYIYVWDYNTYEVTYIYILIHTRCIPVNHWTLVTMPYPLYPSYPPVTGAGISEG